MTNEVTRIDEVNAAQNQVINNHTTVINTLLGGNSNTTTTGATTLGSGANSNNTMGSTLVGNNATATKNDSTVIGNGATSNGTGGIAIGKDALAANDGAIAIGNKSTAAGDNSIALGKGSSTTGNNSIALGAGSVADKDNVVSVGSKGAERQIVNVADGFNAHDAVNVGQIQREILRQDNMNALQNTVILKHERQLQTLGYRVGAVEQDMSGGIAGAAAIAMMPNALPNHDAISFGTGYFNGESAISVGYTATKPTDNGKYISIKFEIISSY